MTWTAVYEYDPDDKVWLARIDEEERCHTWGRTIAEARRHIRDAATLWSDRPIEIVDQVTPPPTTLEAVDHFKAARHAFTMAAKELTAAQATAVGALRLAGLSLREAAGVLGISHQRVGQVGKAVAKAAPAKAVAKKAAPRKAIATKAVPRKRASAS